MQTSLFAVIQIITLGARITPRLETTTKQTMDPDNLPTMPDYRHLCNWATISGRVVVIQIDKHPTQIVQVEILLGTIINTNAPGYEKERRILIQLDKLGEIAAITTDNPLVQARHLDDPHVLRVGEAHLLIDPKVCANWFKEIHPDNQLDLDPRIVFSRVADALMHTRFDIPPALAV